MIKFKFLERGDSAIKLKTKEEKAVKSVVVFVLIAELAFYQLALPFSFNIARAETLPDQPTVQEQSASDASASADSNPTNSDTTAKADKQDSTDEPAWKSCDLTKDEKDIIEKDDCEGCRKETSCDKIAKCIDAVIDIKNKAEVKTDAASTSNTGANTIMVVSESDSAKDALQHPDLAKNSDAQDVKASPDTGITSANAIESAAKIPDENQLPALETVLQSNEKQSSDSAPENDPNNPQAPPSSRKKVDNKVVSEPADATAATDQKNETAETASKISKNSQAASQPDDSASIDTSAAVAVTNVTNEINTNVIGDNVEKITKNIDGVYNGDINLLDEFNKLLEKPASQGSENSEKPANVQVNIDNSATVENDATATADTGQNSIEGEGEGASISTADALAAVNVANIVNVNLIGNNWLFATINVFGDWVGDLIVPGDGLLSVPQSGSVQSSSITTENNAIVENNVAASADTGSNTITGENKNADIQTGSAISVSNVTNIVNTTIIKNSWFFLAINNMGGWVGKAIHWDGDSNANIYSYNFDENQSWESNLNNWFSGIFIKNNADVKNTASANADTGSNSIAGDFKNASIATGNAYSKTNIFNLINTNIIGNNWMFATVNIFGNWKGNVEFAYPDLSVSLSDNAKNVKRGDSYSYNVSVKNNGQADCDNVQLALALPNAVRSNDEGAWTLEHLKAGEEKSFLVNATVSNDLPKETTVLESQAVAATQTKEIEFANNTAKDQVKVFSDEANSGGVVENGEVKNENSPAESGFVSRDVTNASLSISRSSSKKKVKVGDILKQTIVVENTSKTTVKNIQIGDRIKNKKGGAGEYSWAVESLAPGKKAVVTYRLMVNMGAPTGTYESFASAVGVDESGRDVIGNEAKLAFGVGSVENENYYYYYTYTNAGNPSFTLVGGEVDPIVSTAEAASNEDGKVLGASSNAWNRPSDPEKFNPGWIILPAVVLLISYLHRKREKKIN